MSNLNQDLTRKKKDSPQRHEGTERSLLEFASAARTCLKRKSASGQIQAMVFIGEGGGGLPNSQGIMHNYWRAKLC